MATPLNRPPHRRPGWSTASAPLVDKLQHQIMDSDAEPGEATRESPNYKRTMKGWDRSLPRRNSSPRLIPASARESVIRNHATLDFGRADIHGTLADL